LGTEITTRLHRFWKLCEVNDSERNDCMSVLRIYLSSSIANGVLNQKLRDVLPASRFELILPQEFTPNVAHHELPRAIYQRCIDEMASCDGALLVLDAFGIDCASEAGWLCARKKPLIGLAQSSLRFVQNWMVKGNLSGLITSQEEIATIAKSDAILGSIPVRWCQDWQKFGDTLEELVHICQTKGENHDRR
jgi:nucleoside 2-deoxyribosyltransferase